MPNYFSLRTLLTAAVAVTTGCAHRQGQGTTTTASVVTAQTQGPQRVQRQPLVPATPLVLTEREAQAPRPTMATAPQWAPPTVQSFVLRNQLTVYVVPQNGEERVSIRYVNRRASENDVTVTPGLASSTLAFLEEGSRPHPGESLRNTFRDLDMTFNTAMKRDAAMVVVEAPVTSFARAMELLGEAITQPEFAASNLPVVQRQQMLEIQSQSTMLDPIAELTTARILFGPQHRLGAPSTGSAEAVQARQLSEITGYYDRRYIPAHSAIIVVGAVNIDQVRTAAESHFGSWQTRHVPIATIPPGTLAADPQVHLHFINDPSSALTYTFIGFRGPPARSPEAMRMQLAQNMMAELTYSRLIRALRAEDGDSYAVGSDLPDSSLGGLIRLSYAVPARRTAAALTRVVEEILRLRQTPPSSDELERARLRAWSNFVEQFGSTSALATAAADLFVDRLPNDSFAGYQRQLFAITPADVVATANEFYVQEHMIVLFIGNAEQSVNGVADVGLGDMRVYNVPGANGGGAGRRGGH